MKKTTSFFPIFALIGIIVFTACSPRKKMQVSNAHIEQLKKDSIATHRQLDKKNTMAIKNETTATEKTTTTINTKKTTKPENNIKKSTPLPPPKVATIFKSRYPTATEIVWTKRNPSVTSENKEALDYKVYFLLESNKNSAVYSPKGILIETREQIIPDQLPPNIYAAIRKKYPEHHIVSASRLKSSKANGSYIAVLKIQTQEEEKEVMLLENGTFVE